MRVSSIVVSLILVGILVATMIGYTAHVTSQYNTAFDNTSYAAYNRLTTIDTQTQEMNSKLQSLNQSSGITDLVGGFLKSGYQVLRITWSSLGVFTDITDAATNQLGTAAPVSGLITIKNGVILIFTTLFLFGIVTVLIGRQTDDL